MARGLARPMRARGCALRLEVVSEPRITPAGKAQADPKAQHTREVVSISRGLQSRQRRDTRASDGVVEPLGSYPALIPASRCARWIWKAPPGLRFCRSFR